MILLVERLGVGLLVRMAEQGPVIVNVVARGSLTEQCCIWPVMFFSLYMNLFIYFIFHFICFSSDVKCNLFYWKRLFYI